MTHEPATADGGGLVRVRLDLAYEGTDFAGWARQPALRTVQGCLEAALDTVLRTTGLRTTCAGRTDAGVHARGQVVHSDVGVDRLLATRGRSAEDWPAALLRRLNRILPGDLRVRDCRAAAPGFDARFAALWRRYTYRVCDSAAADDPLQRRYVLSWPRPLAVDVMNTAAQPLLGEHDFAAFCRSRPGGTTVRRLQRLEWRRDPDRVVVMDVQADAFCHHLVRGLAGALLAVGEGRRPVDWPGELLRRKRRDAAAPVAAAHGLTLEQVAYPPDDELGARVERTRNRRVP